MAPIPNRQPDPITVALVMTHLRHDGTGSGKELIARIIRSRLKMLGNGRRA